jgi:hypothetical protein
MLHSDVPDLLHPKQAPMARLGHQKT